MKSLFPFSILACFFLAGCIPSSNLPGIGSSSRYDIASYQEDTSLSDNLAGLWMVIHHGTLNETTDGVAYTVTGNIREIVEVTQADGVYYLRTCLHPETLQVMSVSGNDVSVAMNDEQAALTLGSNTAMSGTASHSVTDSSYSGTVKMKKVAALGDTFGLFGYINDSMALSAETAGCLQEGSLHVVGSKLGFSKWADVELANITDWSSDTFYQTGYLYSRGGTADPVHQLRFMEGSVASGITARDYPQSNESVSASVTATSVSAYASNFTLSATGGTVNLNLPIAAPNIVAIESSSTETTTTSDSAPDSFDFLSMLQWMGGLFNISLPW